MKTNIQNTKYKIKPVGVAPLGDPLQKRNTQSGITLVALIITVIVLLILAMVSIRLIMNGGIIDRAENGTTAYTEAEIKEQIKLTYSEWQTARWDTTSGDAGAFITARLQATFGNENVKNVSASNGNLVAEIKTNGEFVKYSYDAETDTVGKVEENNGLLPNEYQQVEYIESTGTQYIFIGEVQMLNLIAEMQYPNFPNECDVIGGMDAYGNNGRLLLGIYNSYYMMGYGNKSDASNIIGDNKKHTYNLNIDKNNNKKIELFIDDKFIYSQTADNLSHPLYFSLFAYTGWGQTTPNRFTSCRIYYFELESQMKLYPCYRKSDNVIGLYDTLERKFYTNQGTGTFLKGADV